MAVHAPSWPLIDQGSMTEASTDLGITEPTNGQRQLSSSNDIEWAKFMSELSHHDQNANIPLGTLALDDPNPSTHFGTMDNLMHTGLPTTSGPSDLDSNGAPHQYTSWSDTSATLPGYGQGLTQSDTWMSTPQQYHQSSYDQPMHFMQGRDGLGIQLAPTSQPLYPSGPSLMSYDQPFMMSQEIPQNYGDDYKQDTSVWDHHEQSVPPQDDLFADDDDAEPEDSADPCYAQLLYRCLKEAPGHTMSLRELYEWVSQHSQKAKDLKNKGWQNSVRHNLSMNAAFQRVPHSATSGPKKGSLWRLTEDALRLGVISTTRYRKDPKRRSDRRSATPALNRQASGARGGRATRDATRLRQQQRHGGTPAANRFRRSERSMPYSPYSTTTPSPGMPPTSPHGPSPYFIDLDTDEATTYPHPLSAGQTPPPQHLMMYEEQPKHEMMPLNFSHGGFFGDNDPEVNGYHQHQHSVTTSPYQASYMSDTGFLTDDNVPALMMSAGHINGRETGNFQ